MIDRPGSICAMISSTTIDLPEHRKEAMEACLREGVFPCAMEHLPSVDVDAVSTSLEMVDKADLYICILGHRYGYIPKKSDISITEMEFDRAVERDIPILVFLMDDNHQFTRNMIEVSDAAQAKLSDFKNKASLGRVRQNFESSVDLRALIIQSISKELKKPREKNENTQRIVPNDSIRAAAPRPPEPFIAHPYSLLETPDVVGRARELAMLDDWVSTSQIVHHSVRILSFVAIGGMGKSALTWKWFNSNVAEYAPWLKGRVWWSFYESDAHFENFIYRTLAYVLSQDERTLRSIPVDDAQEALIEHLTRYPYLIVFDGLERVLMAYARLDAAHLHDDDLDEQTANQKQVFSGIPEDAHETYMEKHRLRLAADPRIGRFLQRLSMFECKSRVLISTRLYPADLQTRTGTPSPGCNHIFLTGLIDADALELWNRYGVSGSPEDLLPLFKAFGNYPLLIRALAGEVAEYRKAPFDFTQWRSDHPEFNPAGLPLVNAKTHVLGFALRGLGGAQRETLHRLAAFRMPVEWGVLRDLLVGKGKACGSEAILDRYLTELEDRGLVGWEKKTNKYDLHPIVRSVVWDMLEANVRDDIFEDLHTYFAASPLKTISDQQGTDDLMPGVEMYHALLGLARYAEAWHVFEERLNHQTKSRVEATKLRYELLSKFVSDEEAEIASERPQNLLAFALEALGDTCLSYGLPGFAISHIERAANHSALSRYAIRTLGAAHMLVGNPFESLSAYLEYLNKCRISDDLNGECDACSNLAVTYARFRMEKKALISATRATKIADWLKTAKVQCRIYLARAACSVEYESFSSAEKLAKIALEIALEHNLQRDEMYAEVIIGESKLRAGEMESSRERFDRVIAVARNIGDVESEISASLGLIEINIHSEDYGKATTMLEHIQGSIDKGPYTEYRSRAYRLSSMIYRATSSSAKAEEAVILAYSRAWAEGPPFAYNSEIEKLKSEVGIVAAQLPDLPPFDYGLYAPLPSVALDPSGRFSS